MRLSCALVPSPDVGDLAALAERLGYDRVWLADSPALYGDAGSRWPRPHAPRGASASARAS